MKLAPIYGGFATTASYCAASISACRTNSPNRLSASDTNRSWLSRFAQLLQRRQLRPVLRHLNQRSKGRGVLKQPLQFRQVAGQLKPIVCKLHA